MDKVRDIFTDYHTNITLERVLWEIQRAFRKKSVVLLLAVLGFQSASAVFLAAKGAGSIYLGMLTVLFFITVSAWILTSTVHGNVKILIDTLLLLTVGVMLQCVFIQEQLLKSQDTTNVQGQLGKLQLEYILAFAVAAATGALYWYGRRLAAMQTCRFLVGIQMFLSGVTLVFGRAVGGVRNWIHIGGLSLQATELTKLIYVLTAAILLGSGSEVRKENLKAFYGITAINILLLAAQSEFGTLLLILLLFFTFLFLFVEDLRVSSITLLVSAAAAVTGTAALQGLYRLVKAGSALGSSRLVQAVLRNYTKIANRVVYWLHPEMDADGLGYQLLKAKESIVLGGWFGTSSVTELPVKTSDLVYPALIQRCGMVFALIVFLVLIFLWLEGIRLFMRKGDRFHQAVGAGLIFMLFYQSIIIISGSTGLAPLTGITLPFISSGGSSLTVCMCTVSLLIVISGNVGWKGAGENEQEAFIKKNAGAAEHHITVRHMYDSLSCKNIRITAGCFRRGRHSEGKGTAESLRKRIHKGEHH